MKAFLRLASLPVLFLCLSTSALPVRAEETAGGSGQVYIPVGTARVRKTIIAFPDPKALGGSKSLVEDTASLFRETVSSDLEFMDLFRLMSKSAFIEDADTAGLALGTFKMTDWSSIGAEFLVKTGVKVESGRVTVEARLFETASSKELLGKQYVATTEDTTMAAHRLANDIVEALTGLPGIFETRIAMVCDRGSRIKEVFVMDFDGKNVKQVTSHRSTSLSPSWSPDGNRLVYSSVFVRPNRVKNIDLFEMNFENNQIRRISNRTGINSGATYSPDGKGMALTMSFLGNPEIFYFNPNTNTVKRLTSSFGVDVDPTFNTEGTQLAFTSSRSGPPMIYKMNRDGSKVSRLTFAGRYNASPTWAPRGGKIAFASWIDGNHADIFLMNDDGTTLERLTKSQGSNEDPHFSPDGNFIVFSSNRTGQKNVYVMNTDGTGVKRLTYGLGNCTQPKWSPAAGRRRK